MTALHRLGKDRHCEIAELLVSELVTNAVLHARTMITLEITQRGDSIRVGVADESARRPKPRSYSDDAMTGRGLTLVQALSSSWGTRSTPAGKQIWFELAEAGS